MPDVDSYRSGVPCWVETLQPDLSAASDFYRGVFGWEIVLDADDDPQYAVAMLRGREVAGIASSRSAGGHDPIGWYTQVRVGNLDDTLSRCLEAGASNLVGPVDARPAGRFAVCTDPAGARLALWEAAAREGAQIVDESNAWAMSVLQTPDLERSRTFYQQVFGWHVQAMGPAELFRLPGYVGGTEHQPVPRDTVAVSMPAAEAAAVGWQVDFWNDDVAALADRVRDLGGSHG